MTTPWTLVGVLSSSYPELVPLNNPKLLSAVACSVDPVLLPDAKARILRSRQITIINAENLRVLFFKAVPPVVT